MSTEIKTLEAGQILINYQLLDEVLFPQKFLRMGLAAFNLEKLTNGYMTKVPPIIGAHPLAVVRGAIDLGQSSSQVIDSKLPLLGVEQMSGSPEIIPLGLAQTQKYEVTPEFIEILRSVPVDERMYPLSLIDDIEQIAITKTENESKLLLYANSLIKRSGVRISAWSADFEVTRILKKTLESLMIEFYRAIQKYGIKPESYSIEPALYNFDIGEVLFGCEISLPYLIRNMNYLIDVDLVEIKEFDLAVFNSDSIMTISPYGKPEEKFQFAGPDNTLGN